MDTVVELGKEGGAWIQFAVEVHCSTGPASQHMEVAHSQGSLYAVGAGEEGTDDLKRGHDMDVAVVVSTHKEEFGHRQELLGAEAAGRWGFGMSCWAYFLDPSAVEDWTFEFDEAVKREGKNSSNFYSLGN